MRSDPAVELTAASGQSPVAISSYKAPAPAAKPRFDSVLKVARALGGAAHGAAGLAS